MKAAVIALIVGMLVASVSAIAETEPKKRNQAADVKPQQRARQVAKPGRPERELSELSEPEDLPFGSAVWWRSMDLRGRGGFGQDN